MPFRAICCHPRAPTNWSSFWSSCVANVGISRTCSLILVPSSARRPEAAVGVTTRLRPGRCSVMHSLQPLPFLHRAPSSTTHFLIGFARQKAVQQVGRQQTLAMSLACIQHNSARANLLAVLVHSDCWRLIRARDVDMPHTATHALARTRACVDTPGDTPLRRAQGFSSASANDSTSLLDRAVSWQCCRPPESEAQTPAPCP